MTPHQEAAEQMLYISGWPSATSSIPLSTRRASRPRWSRRCSISASANSTCIACRTFIQPDNTASRKLVEKLGFRSEGLLRDNLRVGEALAQRNALRAARNRLAQLI